MNVWGALQGKRVNNLYQIAPESALLSRKKSSLKILSMMGDCISRFVGIEWMSMLYYVGKMIGPTEHSGMSWCCLNNSFAFARQER